MGDESRRQGVQVEVAHPVRAHNHRRLLLIESIHDGLQRLGRRVEVVTVQLHRKASAMGIIDRHVPTAANAQVRALRSQDYQLRGRGSKFFTIHFYLFPQNLSRAVRGVIIHHDDIILELRLLFQRTLHCIGDGLGAVKDRDDD